MHKHTVYHFGFISRDFHQIYNKNSVLIGDRERRRTNERLGGDRNVYKIYFYPCASLQSGVLEQTTVGAPT